MLLREKALNKKIGIEHFTVDLRNDPTVMDFVYSNFIVLNITIWIVRLCNISSSKKFPVIQNFSFRHDMSLWPKCRLARGNPQWPGILDLSSQSIISDLSQSWILRLWIRTFEPPYLFQGSLVNTLSPKTQESAISCYALIRGGIKKRCAILMNAALFNFDTTTICCGHTMLAIVLLAAINHRLTTTLRYCDSQRL